MGRVKPAKSWVMRNWWWIPVLGSAVWLVGREGKEFLTNASDLPAAVETTANRFSSWYHDDEAWTGVWSAQPEGYVDASELQLSDIDVRVEIDVKQGVIDGTIATKALCSSFPIWDFVLLEGKVKGSSNTFEGIAYDFIEGQRQNFAMLRFEREGHLMTVTPLEGAVDLFPEKARIAKHPDEAPMQVNAETPGYCYEEKMQFLQLLKEQAAQEKSAQEGTLSTPR
ncbi:hypothetical protein [Stutzerimonas stutzeri]|uniref:hypothetical protein n=1 Tax=Stutzerimonas stutzeri TaxID=316 RepID=UPI0005EB8EAF|nr:hypothetical protein [Stutzerimonas stutzeri]